MRLSRLVYPAAILFLGALYLFYLRPDTAYRLPRYFHPDGTIVPIGDMYETGISRKFIEIGGMAPSMAPAVYTSPDPIIVTLDTGTGIMKKIPNDPFHLMYDFKYYIFFSFVFFLLGFWFLESANDIHLAEFSFVMSAYHFTTFTSLSYHDLVFLSQLFHFLLIPVFINLGLRTTGKAIGGYLLLGELIVISFFSLIAYVGLGNAETFSRLHSLATFLLVFVVLLVTLAQLDNALRENEEDPIERWKRWALVGGTATGMLLPLLLIQFASELGFEGDPYLIPFLFTLLFPAGLVYGTYRINLIPFQFILNRSILAAILTMLLVSVYGIVLLMHSMLLPEQEKQNQWIVNLIFVLILVFFLDPARRYLSNLLDRKIFRISPDLTESLERLATLLSGPVKFQSTVLAFLNEIQTTLKVEKVNILFSETTFPEASFKQGRLLRLSDSSRIWKFFKRERIIVTSYLTYGSGNRGELYRYLMGQNIYLSVGITGAAGLERFQLKRLNFSLPEFLLPVKRILKRRGDNETTRPGNRTALLLGYRKDRRKFRLSEIRYIQEAAVLASMLIDNYYLQIQDLQKRKKIRELFLAGQAQRELTSRDGRGIRGIRISYFNLPVFSVSGDYVDIFPVDEEHLAILLGDVSGHGLGTGYIVSAVRSIVHSHLENGSGLVSTIETLHRFLQDHYRGHEFLTIFAMILNTKTGNMEYINAAHPAPFVITPGEPELTRLSPTQSLIGIVTNQFHSKVLLLKPGQRLFLFSDGVTETFNPEEETYGESRLRTFLQESGNETLEAISERLKTSLTRFRRTHPVHDDTTFFALEYVPSEPPLRGVFSISGIEWETG